MARILLISPLQFIILFLFSSIIISLVTSHEDHGFINTTESSLIHLKNEKLSHVRVYWHDIVSGPNPSAIQIVPPPSNSSPTSFGFLAMIDDPLTEGPALSSKLVGKAQGFYGSASQKGYGLILGMNFVFTEGKYNGSTIAILGRNEVFSAVREMPVIGGSGVFRFARGFVRARTHEFDRKTGYTVVEYKAYVLHY